MSLSGHVVGGGCHAKFRSEGDVPLVAYIPYPTVMTSCRWQLDAQIGGDDAGYIAWVLLTAPDTGVPCVPISARKPTAKSPWALQLNEVAGAESLARRGVPGGSQGSCTVHLPVHGNQALRQNGREN